MPTGAGAAGGEALEAGGVWLACTCMARGSPVRGGTWAASSVWLEEAFVGVRAQDWGPHSWERRRGWTQAQDAGVWKGPGVVGGLGGLRPEICAAGGGPSGWWGFQAQDPHGLPGAERAEGLCSPPIPSLPKVPPILADPLVVSGLL